jgi:hypothetical protein
VADRGEHCEAPRLGAQDVMLALRMVREHPLRGWLQTK